MTKKHYIKIAKAIKKFKKSFEYNYNEIAYLKFLDDIAIVLQQDNPRFSAKKFIAYIEK